MSVSYEDKSTGRSPALTLDARVLSRDDTGLFRPDRSGGDGKLRKRMCNSAARNRSPVVTGRGTGWHDFLNFRGHFPAFPRLSQRSFPCASKFSARGVSPHARIRVSRGSAVAARYPSRVLSLLSPFSFRSPCCCLLRSLRSPFLSHCR